MPSRHLSEKDPKRRIQRRDRLAHVAVDALDASFGAVAGGAVGMLAGPAGAVAGAALGAVAGGALGHQADSERKERDLHDHDLDAIDVEEEFFGEAGALGVAGPEPAGAPAKCRAFAVLRSEHAIIETVLAAFARWRDEIEDDEADGREEASRFLQFFRMFNDATHHAKEEGILFAVMQRYGLGGAPGPIDVMLHEHRLLRSLAAEIEEHARGARPWTKAERARVVATATTYLETLRRHIVKEDTVLFPMAASRLPPAAKTDLDERFHVFAAQRGEEEALALRRLARSLVTRRSGSW